MTTLILGIDPGLNGGYALVEFGNFNVRLVEHGRTPSVKAARGRVLDEVAYSSALRSACWNPEHHGAQGLALAVIEKVSSQPRDGGASAFKFGYVAGFARGVIRGRGIRCATPTPSQWKKAEGLTDDKALSLARAAELLPANADLFSVKANDGIAEAVLLANHGWKHCR